MTTSKPEVKRYELESGYDSMMRRVNRMKESEDGVYVRFDDYEALQAECKRLQAAMIEAKSYIEHYMYGGSSYREPAAKAVALIDAAIQEVPP